jgi:pilus assembly protein Flp/PilA
MNALINRFLQEEDGVTAVEYGLIAGLMAVALVTAVGVLSGGISSAFSYIANKLTGLGAATGGSSS